MSLETWSFLIPHDPTIAEIQQLFDVVDRDLSDAGKDVSADARFSLAFRAGLQLCTIALHVEGYEVKPRSPGHHSLTIQTLPETLGESQRETYVYLSGCSNMRNLIEYERAGVVSANDARELYQTAGELRENVLDWLKREHPELVPNKLK